MRKLCNRVRAAKQRRDKKGQRRVRVYLQLARQLAARAEQSLEELATAGAAGGADPARGEGVLALQPYTRWCSKGKAGRPVELGVPVAVVESRQQFVLHRQLLWGEEDVDAACALVEQLYPQLEACSFDRGFVESQFDPWDRLRINPKTVTRDSQLDSFLSERVHKVSES